MASLKRNSFQEPVQAGFLRAMFQAARIRRKTYTKEEAIDLIRQLTAGEKTKITKVAEFHKWGTPYEAEDLIQEAFKRIAEGERNCPRDIPFVVSYCGTIRGIAGDYRRQARKKQTVALNDQVDARDDTFEERLMHKHAAKKMIAAFAHDEAAQNLLIGMAQGLKGEVLYKELSLSKTEYESKRKYIRRHLEKIKLI